MTTVLVVDDEPIVRDVVTRYLARDGHRALAVGDGDEARSLIEREAPSLVVLDVMLPGEDGLSLCRWIRSSSDVPVILLTARGEEADRIVGLELGAETTSRSRFRRGSSRSGCGRFFVERARRGRPSSGSSSGGWRSTLRRVR